MTTAAPSDTAAVTPTSCASGIELKNPAVQPASRFPSQFDKKNTPITRIGSLMMGVFFLSNWLGNLLAGWTAGVFSSMPLAQLFGVPAAVSLGAAVVLFVLLKPVQRLMGGVR